MNSLDVRALLIESREEKKLSKAEVARLIDVPYGTYNSYELRGSLPKKMATLLKLADVLGINPDLLLEDDSPLPKDVHTDRITEEFSKSINKVLNHYRSEYRDKMNTYNLPESFDSNLVRYALTIARSSIKEMENLCFEMLPLFMEAGRLPRSEDSEE